MHFAEKEVLVIEFKIFIPMLFNIQKLFARPETETLMLSKYCKQVFLDTVTKVRQIFPHSFKPEVFSGLLFSLKCSS